MLRSSVAVLCAALSTLAIVTSLSSAAAQVTSQARKAAPSSGAALTLTSRQAALSKACVRTSLLVLHFDGQSRDQYYNPATRAVSDVPPIQGEECTAAAVAAARPTESLTASSVDTVEDALMTAAGPVAYGSAILTPARPYYKASDLNGTWSVQVNHATKNFPGPWGFQVKPSPFTVAWSGTTMRVTTPVSNGGVCSYYKAGQPPTYFQHGTCTNHKKYVKYTTTGRTQWRFVISGASGTVTLDWTGSYTIY